MTTHTPAGTREAHGTRAVDRELQRDARAWQRFTGMKYTQALRLMQHPLAQGILGERISARRLVRVLTEHPVLQDPNAGEGATLLGEHGLYRAGVEALRADDEHDFLTVVLTAEVLRMFTPAPAHGKASSYGLKARAESYLGGILKGFSYVSNGKLIWAAAALGLEVVDGDPDAESPNPQVGIDALQVDYMRRMETPRSEPRAHQHRPPGYLYLKAALEHYAETGKTPARWDGVDASSLPQTSPFHEWLIAQVDPAGGAGSFGSLERLAYDYRAGVAEGDHRVAATGTDLLAILDELGVDGEVRVIAGRTVAAWMRSNTDETTLRPERTDHLASDHEGWGAGSGTTSRTEYACPCGQGRIVEEHDDIPGFRDHSVFLDCDECRAHWRLVDGSAVLEPLSAESGI
ncbi:hypothetical protein QWJ90_12630 [Microbacterium oryzae]|uniref:hypothetical protein n=1 Tax=Microbacterium oryzae TaxID=743009 RepID=UPI0025B136F2|nr:hypothetical protein [Microbacterium oryzae]MDN3311775.1 hypothetical protein [Microbacterium oryzae]